MEQALQHRIRERAYELWNSSGRVEGQAEHHWFVAEREVLSEMSREIAVAETVSLKPPRRNRQRNTADGSAGRPPRRAHP
jgi:hypothetical protein